MRALCSIRRAVNFFSRAASLVSASARGRIAGGTSSASCAGFRGGEGGHGLAALQAAGAQDLLLRGDRVIDRVEQRPGAFENRGLLAVDEIEQRAVFLQLRAHRGERRLAGVAIEEGAFARRRSRGGRRADEVFVGGTEVDHRPGGSSLSARKGASRARRFSALR